MRVYMFASCEVPQPLRTYAEARVRRAVGRVSNRLRWVAVRLSHRENHAADSSVVCQLDAWLNGIGLVTATHIDVDTFVAIDRAAARFKQAALCRIRETESSATSPSPRRGIAPWNPGRLTHVFTVKQIGRASCRARG